jgi:hypothetical protein
MPASPRLEGTLAVVALLLAAAFVASFILGLRGPARSSVGLAEPERQQAPVRAAGRVEVLNASGRAGLARAATDRLRSGGYDVVFFGNASGFSGDSTVILDRTGNDAVARAVARYLGVGSVRTVRDTTLFLDATVVIGRDWR